MPFSIQASVSWPWKLVSSLACLHACLLVSVWLCVCIHVLCVILSLCSMVGRQIPGSGQLCVASTGKAVSVGRTLWSSLWRLTRVTVGQLFWNWQRYIGYTYNERTHVYTHTQTMWSGLCKHTDGKTSKAFPQCKSITTQSSVCFWC